jgi:hypothetical protein
MFTSNIWIETTSERFSNSFANLKFLLRFFNLFPLCSNQKVVLFIQIDIHQNLLPISFIVFLFLKFKTKLRLFKNKTTFNNWGRILLHPQILLKLSYSNIFVGNAMIKIHANPALSIWPLRQFGTQNTIHATFLNIRESVYGLPMVNQISGFSLIWKDYCSTCINFWWRICMKAQKMLFQKCAHFIGMLKYQCESADGVLLVDDIREWHSFELIVQCARVTR